MKCLYQMYWKDLKKLVEEDLCLTDWYVAWDESLSNRARRVREFETDNMYGTNNMQHRYELIKRRADEACLKYNETEIVTWFDTLCILYHAFDMVDYEYLRDNIVILQEYNIPFSNKRADYVLCYDNKILILEFSFYKLGYELQYETKLQQAIGYKELIGNVLPKEIDIGTYTFLVDSGYVKDNDKVYNLADYIEKFFNKNIDLAIRALGRLDERDRDEKIDGVKKEEEGE